MYFVGLQLCLARRAFLTNKRQIKLLEPWKLIDKVKGFIVRFMPSGGVIRPSNTNQYVAEMIYSRALNK